MLQVAVTHKWKKKKKILNIRQPLSIYIHGWVDKWQIHPTGQTKSIVPFASPLIFPVD